MLPIRGRQAGLFRLIAIPTAALLASHLVLYRRLPGDANYQFPWAPFLTISLVMISCWEANLLVFRRLDRQLPFHQNPLRRIGRQLLEGGLVTTLTFAIVLTLISGVGFQSVPSVRQYAIGLLICFTIASIINGVYVGFYLIHVIYWQKQQSAGQLNVRLADQQRRRIGPAEVDRSEPLKGSTHATLKPLGMLPVRSKVLVEMGNHIEQLNPDEIAYFYSAGGIVKLVRTGGRKFTTSYDSLAVLHPRLPANQFFQINRQFIVNLNAVRTVRDAVNLKLDILLVPALTPGQETEQVSISRYRSAEFRKWLTTTNPH